MIFPISEASSVQFVGPPPQACDVVVIGAGVIGVMTAWFLAKRGLRVTICEKGRVAGEQSSRNWGWVRQQGRDPAELPLMMEASRMWPKLATEAGDDLGFSRCGVLYIANSAKDMARYEAWIAHARAHQLDTRLLTEAELSAMIPAAKAKWYGGLWTASDARAEPWAAVPALARAVDRMGVRLVENCAVRALDIAAGRIAGVATEQGSIACDQVVLAGGAWSLLLARAHGVDFPQLSVRATVAATQPMPAVFAGNAADAHFAFRRRQDGGYSLALGAFHEFYIGPDAFRHIRTYLPQVLGDPLGTRFLPAAPKDYPDAWSTPRHWDADTPSPFEANRVLNPSPSPYALRKMVALFAKTFPHLGKPRIKIAWAGMIDSLPDMVPVIDRVPQVQGLVLATGMCGHGFGIGPAIGRVVADLVAGNPTGHDLSRFRYARFTDGSTLKPGPAL